MFTGPIGAGGLVLLVTLLFATLYTFVRRNMDRHSRGLPADHPEGVEPALEKEFLKARPEYEAASPRQRQLALKLWMTNRFSDSP